MRIHLQLYKGLSLHKSQVAHQAGAYPGFSSMKQLGVFLLPPRMLVHHRVAPPPCIKFNGTHLYIHQGGKRHCESKVSCPRTQVDQSPWPGLKPACIHTVGHWRQWFLIDTINPVATWLLTDHLQHSLTNLQLIYWLTVICDQDYED